ncbi:MAG: hypothetical protein Q9205_004341 [Flavoplaca limonia]
MDINQLIDSDTSASRPRREVENLHNYPVGYQQHREQRPPQPPPLRPPGQNDLRSPSASSHNTTTLSPYQKTPTSALSTNQYPFPPPSIQSPANSTKAISSHQYEAQSFVSGPAQQLYGQTASLPQTPTSITPTGSYPPFQQQRPPSSHSASTPTSGHAQTPTFLRDSPQQIHAQVRGNYGPHSNHPHLSQPGTPLGPPTSLGRQGSSLRRESPGSYDRKRSNSGGSHGQQLQTPPANFSQHPSLNSSTAYTTHHTNSPPQQNTFMSRDRERSISVSPKTTLPRQPVMNSVGAAMDVSRNSQPQVPPTKRKIGDPRMDDPILHEQPAAKRSMSLGVGGMLNADDENEPRTPNRRSNVQHSNVFQMPPRSGTHESMTHEDLSVTPGGTSFSDAPGRGVISLSNISPPSQTSVKEKPRKLGAVAADSANRPSQAPSQSKGSFVTGSTSSVHATPVPVSGNDMTQPSNSVQNNTDSQYANTKAKPWKRFRDPKTPIPIFAHSFDRYNGSSRNGRRQAMSKSPLAMKQEIQGSAPNSSLQQQSNGHIAPNMDAVQSVPDSTGNLGPWEPTITGVIPAEELTREIMDYIIGIIAPMQTMQGPILDMIEIEAKIGHIVDKDTDDRIRLPTRTEVMIDHTNPNTRTTFRSSMTESQHQQLNKFLNRCLAESQPPPPGAPSRESRVPLTYVHTRLKDSFYDLTQDALNALPPTMLGYFNLRKRPKVRITTDQKDGSQLAKIIKVRIADREIYSPKTAFDWRVSVNLEMNYEGDMRGLVETTEGKDRRKPDRNKDRVSYKHGPYQIDLTQVKPTEVTHQSEKEHELEVEVSSAAIRQQIDLVLHNQPNRYEDLVQGFVDNVRTLARFCKDR